MAFVIRWAGAEDLDRVADARMGAYTTAQSQRADYRRWMREDRRPAEFLLAEQDGEPVGTATSMDMSMWVRGGRVSCQGVAWVGTIKTHRRVSRHGQPGTASMIMREMLRRARERGCVVSALMPFRTSFYEHFGYGIAETRHEWTVPVSILPRGDSTGVRFMTPDDLAGVKACRQRMDEAGQCAVERTDQSWQHHAGQWDAGYGVVDQLPTGGIRSWMQVVEVNKDGHKSLRVADGAWDSSESLLRQLKFLGSLRDQFGQASLALPRDWPLNHVLRESQIPHRVVEHATAVFVPQTRMQVRILDHVRYLQSLQLPPQAKGSATIAIRECEGDLVTLRLELEGGQIVASPDGGAADIELSDCVWASVATGQISASTAARFGLLRSSRRAALAVLDALADGPAPFCNEYF